eukprot:1214037-Karenia_brevis.AAC.1
MLEQSFAESDMQSTEKNNGGPEKLLQSSEKSLQSNSAPGLRFGWEVYHRTAQGDAAADGDCLWRAQQ